MKRAKKTFLHKAVLLPLAAGILAACTFFVFAPLMQESSSLKNQSFQAAYFEENYTPASIEVGGEKSVKKSDISLDDNTQIGNISVGGADLPLVYNASSVSCASAVSLSANGSLPGEKGSAFIYGSNSVLKNVGGLKSGSEFNVNTAYGSAVFVVKDVFKVKGEYNVFALKNQTQRGVVLYADADDGVGISDYYDVAVAEMKSGTTVED